MMQTCRASQATQPVAGIGHNGGPQADIMALFAIIGPRKTQPVRPFECGAAWVRFANMLELRRLAKLQGRIERKKASLKQSQDERKLIMNRCIRRMGRANDR